MKKFLFVTILVLAIALRFFKLGAEPASLDWDEVSLGYNAYSLLLNGTDEYGNSWPLSIRSFGDYKPPAYTYLDIIPTAIFGLNEFSTRFPSAFAGVVTVIGVYLLTKEMFPQSQNKEKKLAKIIEHLPLCAMFVFAISPWHIQFSRIAFEGNIAVFFVTYGMYFLLRWFNTNKHYNLFAAAIFLAGSFYAYHAPRLVVPLLLLGILFRYHKTFFKYPKQVICAVILAAVLTFPLGYVLVRGTAASRFDSVSIFNPSIKMLRPLDYENEDKYSGATYLSWIHNRRFEYIKNFIGGYISHYNVLNMFLIGDVVERHHAPDVGLFYLIELLFMIIGIITLIKYRFSYKFLFFYWVAIAPIPAAISTGTPHAIRSILFLPLPQIALAVGILKFYEVLKSSDIIKHYKLNGGVIAIIITIVLYSTNFIYYLNQYYANQSIEYAYNWQYGYKQIVDYVRFNGHKYDKIIVTTAYDQPYIYFLYYLQYDPRLWINNGEFNKGFDKFEFRTIQWQSDRNLHNTLLIGEPIEIPEGEPGTLEVVRYLGSGKDVYRIITSQK